MVSADNPQALRSELAAMPFVEKVGTFQGTCLTGNYTSMSTFPVDKNGKTEDVSFYLADLDSTALDIYGLRLKKDFGQTAGAYYVNEEGERQLGLGKDEREFDYNKERIQLSGVFADFHIESILANYKPFLFQIKPTADMENPMFLVKTDGSAEAEQRMRDAIVKVDGNDNGIFWKVWGLKDGVIRKFEYNLNTLHIVALFAIVALVISTLGYVGMSVFFIRQSKKEVGIRKIMGCSTGKVTTILLRRFCMPRVVSYTVAIPLAWYVMEHWLQDFAYRISLAPWIFLLVIFVSLVQAVLAVIIQTLRAAHTNPVETIKTE